ncbi:MAG: YtxH domain-containing protein [Candidatus Velthaea sp.]|jgi:gas vesicle protein
MSDERNSNSGPGFLAGLLIGALAGATVAMVLAPQAGEDTRDLLRAKAREASDRVRDVAEDIAKTAPVAPADLLARGKQIVDDARSRLDAAVAEGKDAAAQIRSTLENES